MLRVSTIKVVAAIKTLKYYMQVVRKFVSKNSKKTITFGRCNIIVLVTDFRKVAEGSILGVSKELPLLLARDIRYNRPTVNSSVEFEQRMTEDVMSQRCQTRAYSLRDQKYQHRR